MNRTGIRNRRGQSIIEYLVVAAAIIAAVIVFGPQIGTQVKTIGTNAVTRTGTSATTVNSIASGKN